jgi:hypothetical protein
MVGADSFRLRRRRRLVIGRRRRGSIVIVPKRTPIEQAIAEQTDRRVIYERKMREGGNRRVTMWVPSSVWPELQELCSCLVHSDDPAQFAAAIRELTTKVKGA